jgi:hypothetical protein
MPDKKLYTLRNPFTFNRDPISENEARRVARWLDSRLKKKGINNYSVGYYGEDGKFYVELTDRNIIDIITANPEGATIPRNK